MSKHTPGPWKVVSPKEGGCLDQKENRLICTKINNHTYHIAETFQYRNGEFNAPDGVSLANARLIAACPELFELLKAAKCPCCDGSGGYYDNCGNPTQCQWCDETKQALAKATG